MLQDFANTHALLYPEDQILVITPQAFRVQKRAAVLEQIRSSHFTKVCLAPLMLTAGTHAVKHLAGTLENSWQNRCRAAGLETRIRLSGLGSSLEIQELFLRHLSASLVEN